MDDYKETLREQIKEACARALYTYEAQNVRASKLKTKARYLKIAQIVTSALSAAGITVALTEILMCDKEILLIATTLVSFISLALDLYCKEFQMASEVLLLCRTSNELWIIREEYYSLLTDFDEINVTEIKKKRDEIADKLKEIYKNAPRTDNEDYEEACNRLKHGEQTFTNEEIQKIMPYYL